MAVPLEFFFQEQSYSSLHSGRSLAWDHVRDFAPISTIPAAPSPISAELSPISADIARAPMRRRRLLRDSQNIVKHTKTS